MHQMIRQQASSGLGKLLDPGLALFQHDRDARFRMSDLGGTDFRTEDNLNPMWFLSLPNSLLMVHMRHLTQEAVVYACSSLFAPADHPRGVSHPHHHPAKGRQLFSSYSALKSISRRRSGG